MSASAICDPKPPNGNVRAIEGGFLSKPKEVSSSDNTGVSEKQDEKSEDGASPAKRFFKAPLMSDLVFWIDLLCLLLSFLFCFCIL